MSIFLLCEIRTEYFAKYNFALASAKFAFHEIYFHRHRIIITSNIQLLIVYFFSQLSCTKWQQQWRWYHPVQYDQQHNNRTNSTTGSSSSTSVCLRFFKNKVSCLFICFYCYHQLHIFFTFSVVQHLPKKFTSSQKRVNSRIQLLKPKQQ